VLFLRRENAYQCEDDRFERDRHGRGKPDSRRVRAAVKQPSSSRQAVRIIIRESSSLANPRTSSARDGTKSRIHRTDGEKSKERGTEERGGEDERRKVKNARVASRRRIASEGARRDHESVIASRERWTRGSRARRAEKRVAARCHVNVNGGCSRGHGTLLARLARGGACRNKPRGTHAKHAVVALVTNARRMRSLAGDGGDDNRREEACRLRGDYGEPGSPRSCSLRCAS